MSAPLTGVLRAGQSVSEGISGSANWVGSYGKAKLEQLKVNMVRVRPCRRIDLRGRVRIYNEDLAFVHKILINTNNSFFKNQQIKYYVLLPTLDLQGNVLQNRKSLLIVTNEYLLYIRVYNFLDLQSEKYLQKCLMMSEKLSNIYTYSIKAKPSRIIQAKKSAQKKDENNNTVYIG